MYIGEKDVSVVLEKICSHYSDFTVTNLERNKTEKKNVKVNSALSL